VSDVSARQHLRSATQHLLVVLRLRNDLYCVGWGVKLY